MLHLASFSKKRNIAAKRGNPRPGRYFVRMSEKEIEIDGVVHCAPEPWLFHMHVIVLDVDLAGQHELASRNGRYRYPTSLSYLDNDGAKK
jgi:hypothetical protein